MGETWISGVEAEDNRGGGHIQKAEENQGKLRGVREKDGSIVATQPHVELPQDSHTTHPGGGLWRRGTRDICGVLPTGVEVSDMSSGWVPREGTQPGKTQREFYVPALEGKNCNPTGGPSASPTVQPIRDSHAGGTYVETQEGGQMRKGDGYALTTDRHGYGREFGGNGVHLVWEGRGSNGGGGETV